MANGTFMIGKMLISKRLKKLHINARTKKPAATPRQNSIDFLKLYLFANDIAIKLLGPGVKLLTNTNNKKDNKGTFKLPFHLVYDNAQNDQ